MVPAARARSFAEGVTSDHRPVTIPAKPSNAAARGELRRGENGRLSVFRQLEVFAAGAPRRSNFEIGKPRASSAIGEGLARNGKAVGQFARPMPTACDPCPGKRNATLMDIAEMILPDGGGERSGFVVSHPCGGKKPQGWGTEYLWKDHVPDSVPPLLVVGVVVQLTALAVRSGRCVPGSACRPRICGRRGGASSGNNGCAGRTTSSLRPSERPRRGAMWM